MRAPVSESVAGRRHVARKRNDFDFVAVGIAQESCIVVAIVLGADARLSCILATVLKPGLIEFADRVAVAGAKRNVRPISWLGPHRTVAGPFKAERVPSVKP